MPATIGKSVGSSSPLRRRHSRRKSQQRSQQQQIPFQPMSFSYVGQFVRTRHPSKKLAVGLVTSCSDNKSGESFYNVTFFDGLQTRVSKCKHDFFCLDRNAVERLSGTGNLSVRPGDHIEVSTTSKAIATQNPHAKEVGSPRASKQRSSAKNSLLLDAEVLRQISDDLFEVYIPKYPLKQQIKQVARESIFPHPIPAPIHLTIYVGCVVKLQPKVENAILRGARTHLELDSKLFLREMHGFEDIKSTSKPILNADDPPFSTSRAYGWQRLRQHDGSLPAKFRIADVRFSTASSKFWFLIVSATDFTRHSSWFTEDYILIDRVSDNAVNDSRPRGDLLQGRRAIFQVRNEKNKSGNMEQENGGEQKRLIGTVCKSSETKYAPENGEFLVSQSDGRMLILMQKQLDQNIVKGCFVDAFNNLILDAEASTAMGTAAVQSKQKQLKDESSGKSLTASCMQDSNSKPTYNQQKEKRARLSAADSCTKMSSSTEFSTDETGANIQSVNIHNTDITGKCTKRESSSRDVNLTIQGNQTVGKALTVEQIELQKIQEQFQQNFQVLMANRDIYCRHQIDFLSSSTSGSNLHMDEL